MERIERRCGVAVRRGGEQQLQLAGCRDAYGVIGFLLRDRDGLLLLAVVDGRDPETVRASESGVRGQQPPISPSGRAEHRHKLAPKGTRDTGRTHPPTPGRAT